MIKNKIRVIFVCLGNICRSPMAEVIFNDKIKKMKLDHQITGSSAGTARWHIGENADPRTIETAARHGISMNHKVRQMSSPDLDKFEYILAMDEENLKDIRLMFRGKKEGPKVFKIRDFDTSHHGADVPDPYYGEEEDFDAVYRILDKACENFIDFLVKEHKFRENEE